MKQNTAEILVDTLISWGITTIFGIPGEGNNSIMEVLRKRRDKLRFIQTRHEESAAFMACAHAKYTGKLGACIAASGPGGVHLLNGLYDAKLDRQPVIAITGSTGHDLMNTHFQQDIQLDRLMDDVSVYSACIMGPAHTQSVVSLACRTALARRGVAHVTVPSDLQEKTLEQDTLSLHNVSAFHTSPAYTESTHIPKDEDIVRAAEILNAGKRIAILVGRGALGTTTEIELVAEKLGAPVIKALLGKAVLPDDSPYTVGNAGYVGTLPSYEALKECDTLFIIGSTFPYMDNLPVPGKARAVQVDIDPARISLRYPVDAAIVGATKPTLERLIPKLKRNDDRQFLKKNQERMVRWWQVLEENAASRALPLGPQRLLWELGKRLDNFAIVSADCGANAFFWARYVRAKRGQMHSLSGMLESMANALPYTIAAQLAYPERQCVGIAGDGGFSMLMGEFATAVKYNLPIKMIVMKNDSLAQVKWEQLSLAHPDYGVDLQPIDFVKFAESCGATGVKIEYPEDCGPAIDKALKTPGPVLVEALVNVLEPVLAPQKAEEFERKLEEVLAQGEPDVETIRKLVEARERQLSRVG